MLAFTHSITGAFVAVMVKDPTIALAISFISHPLMDLCPHWDFNTRWAKRSKINTFIISAVDSGFGMITGLLLLGTKENVFFVIASMLIAQWADFLEAPYHFGFANFFPFKHIKRPQHLWHTKLGWPWGFIPQAAITIFIVWYRFAIMK